MNDIRPLIEQLVRAGVDAIEAAEVVSRAVIIGAASMPKARSPGAVRQERYRRNKASLVTDVTVCDAPSSPEEMSPTPPETQPSPTVPPSPPKGGGFPLAKPDAAAEALEIYNRHAALAGWPKARMTEARRPKLQRRVGDAGGLEGWDEALGRARGSPFLTGDNRDGWKADLDFFLRQSSFTKLLEGSYDGKRNGSRSIGQRTGQSASGHDALLAAMADRFAFGDGERGPDFGPGGVRAKRDAEGVYRWPDH